MTTCFSNETRKAAKPHRCYLCGQRIEIGESHVYSTGVNYGDFWAIRMHPECEAETNDWDTDDWETFDLCEFKRPMTAFDPCI